MLTAVAHMEVAGAKRYFALHLSRNDYYAAGDNRPGQWVGVAAKELGLVGEVGREEFLGLCDNQHPGSGERFTQRERAQGERRVYYDFTCSAPKLVSILAVTFDAPELVEAHERATRMAIEEMERFAGTQGEEGGWEWGSGGERDGGAIGAAAFE